MTSLRTTVERIAAAPDRQLAWQFFVLFARTEYALKRCSFFKKDRRTAEADWDAFALEISTIPSDAKIAAAYLCANPPRRQELVDGALHWSEIPHGEGERELVFVCRCIKTVRNNLFHGGKFQDGPIDEPIRDRKLLACASDVIIALVDSSQRVRRVFLEGLSED